jgi:hypothetical protein
MVDANVIRISKMSETTKAWLFIHETIPMVSICKAEGRVNPDNLSPIFPESNICRGIQI